MFKSCGCKICKAGKGKIFNDFVINENPTLEKAKSFLKDNDLIADKRLINNHLSAYNLSLNDSKAVDVEVTAITKNDEKLNNYLDFSQYDFDVNNPDTIVNYLQKLHLKIHLNQCQLVLKSQMELMIDENIDIPSDVIRNAALTWKMLNEVSGIGIITNQYMAIKTVENMGYKLQGDNDVSS
jgi:hypothetical protein